VAAACCCGFRWNFIIVSVILCHRRRPPVPAVSAPLQNPITRLREVAEESAMLMWKYYDLHQNSTKRDGAWLAVAHQLYEKCMAAESRVWRLIELEENRGRLVPGE
jgi:hypothetical protein